MSLNYFGILRKTWTIIWKYKILWVFGILASCSVRDGGLIIWGNGTDFNLNKLNQYASMLPAIGNLFSQFQQNPDAGDLPKQIMAALAPFILFAIVLIVLFIIVRLVMLVLGTFGQAGLIKGTFKIEEGAEKIGYGDLFISGRKYFWKIILFKLFFFTFNLAAGLILFGINTLSSGLALCCLIIPLIIFDIAYWIVEQYALVALVGDSMGIIAAIAKGWNVFRTTLISSTLMALLNGLIESVYAFITGIPISLALILGLFGMISFFTAPKEMAAPTISFFLAGTILLTYLPIAIFLNGVKTAYFGVNWVLVYRTLTGRGPQAD